MTNLTNIDKLDLLGNIGKLDQTMKATVDEITDQLNRFHDRRDERDIALYSARTGRKVVDSLTLNAMKQSRIRNQLRILACAATKSFWLKRELEQLEQQYELTVAECAVKNANERLHRAQSSLRSRSRSPSK